MLESLRRAVDRLAEAPTELTSWLLAAEALQAHGDAPRIRDAYAGLGRTASEHGRVALAVACVHHLRALGHAAAASELLSEVARVHARGSSRIDPALRARPPLPPVPGNGGAPVAARREALADRLVEMLAAAAGIVAQHLPARLPPTPLVSVLPERLVVELVDAMSLAVHPAGDVIVELGQPASSLFWIARGAVSVRRGEHLLGELRAGAFFGEIALLGGTRRTATVVCSEESWVLEVAAATLERLAASEPQLGQVLAEHARARLLANVMRTSVLFSQLSSAEREQLLPLFRTTMFQPNQSVIRQGDENESLHVLASGMLEVRQDGHAIGHLEPGDGVGEISLISRKPATADVVAQEPSVTLRLSRSDFDRIAVHHPALLAEVYKLLVQRERANQALIVHDAEALIV